MSNKAENAYLEYMRSAGPDVPVNGLQHLEMRKAFFAGLVWLLTEQIKHGKNTDALARFVEGISIEASAFMERGLRPVEVCGKVGCNAVATIRPCLKVCAEGGAVDGVTLLEVQSVCCCQEHFDELKPESIITDRSLEACNQWLERNGAKPSITRENCTLAALPLAEAKLP